MSEVSYKLPERVIKEESGLVRRIELGRISIAGFVDWEEFVEGPNYYKWPYPLFLLDEKETNRRRYDSGEFKTYWHLEDQLLTNRSNSLSQVCFPDDGRQPFIYMGSANWPSETAAHIFEVPIIYNQAEFESRVYDYS